MMETRAELTAARETVVSTLNAGLFAPLAEGLAPANLAVRSSWRHRSITVEWADGPFPADVRSVLEDLNLDVTLVITHRDVWSCGMFHISQEDAWLYHEGSELEELVGACDCCGRGGDYEVPEAVLDAARSTGFATSACRSGTFRRCAPCGGTGRIVTLRKPVSMTTCETCNGDRTFDVSTEEGVAAWHASQSAAVAAWQNKS